MTNDEIIDQLAIAFNKFNQNILELDDEIYKICGNPNKFYDRCTTEEQSRLDDLSTVVASTLHTLENKYIES